MARGSWSFILYLCQILAKGLILFGTCFVAVSSVLLLLHAATHGNYFEESLVFSLKLFIFPMVLGYFLLWVEPIGEIFYDIFICDKSTPLNFIFSILGAIFCLSSLVWKFKCLQN